jgi:hypothetical protein
MPAMHAALIPHPKTPSSAVRTIEATVSRGTADVLSVRYSVRGALNGIRWPRTDAPQRTDRLWEHTCFEAFLRTPHERSYIELNFAPSGRWAAYRFTDYRAGMSDLDVTRPPHIISRIENDQMELHATLDLSGCVAGDRAMRLALCAVIEDQDQHKSYWALSHPGERPDFHRADAFAMELVGS